MKSGSLRSTVQVKRKSDEQDDYGALTTKTVNLYKAKANIRYLSGSELIKASVQTNIEVATVKMRYDKRMGYDCVLCFDGHEFEVANIKPDDRKREFIVTATREII